MLTDPSKVEYQRAYQKNYHKDGRRRELRLLRTAWLDELKSAPCGDCNGTFPPECMDFDHIDPSTKVHAVSYMAVAGYSGEAVRAEVEKCRLICANCHRIRTAKQQRRRQL